MDHIERPGPAVAAAGVPASMFGRGGVGGGARQRLRAGLVFAACVGTNCYKSILVAVVLPLPRCIRKRPSRIGFKDELAISLFLFGFVFKDRAWEIV